MLNCVRPRAIRDYLRGALFDFVNKNLRLLKSLLITTISDCDVILKKILNFNINIYLNSSKYIFTGCINIYLIEYKNRQKPLI